VSRKMKSTLPVLLIAFSCSLWAQSGELWFSGGASILSNAHLGTPDSSGDPSDVQLSNSFRAGIRYAFNSGGPFGHEIQYAYNRTNITDQTGSLLAGGKDGMAIHQAGYNLLYYLRNAKEDSKIRPFVTAGIHVSDFVLPGAATTQGSSPKVGFNYGAGVKIKLSTLFGFRFDVRGYETAKPSWGGLLLKQGGLMHQVEASAGLGIYF
jgi:opacity protein-like surface antigen